LANELSRYYDVELVVTYKNEDELTNLINQNVKIKYLTSLFPNRSVIDDLSRRKEYFKLFLELIKSLYILSMKYLTLILYVRTSTSQIIVSTRKKYAKVLSIFKKRNINTFTYEHRHHNNDQKYIAELHKSVKGLNGLIVLAENLKQDYKGFFESEGSNIHVLPNGISPLTSGTSNLSNKKIVAIGRLHPVKGFDRLISIFSLFLKENPNWTLTIIGDGDQEEDLKFLANRLNLSNNIDFTGKLSKLEVEKQLVSSDILCMTSHSEGLPMVLLEAMNFSIPCIAYDVGEGIKTIIKSDFNGYLIPDGDQEMFLGKLNSLANDSKLIEILSSNAKKSTVNYSIENIAKQAVEIFERQENYNDKS